MKIVQRIVARAFVASTVLCLVEAVLMVVSASSAGAQDPTPARPTPRAQPPRRQETIEIRGQVPTPQVVTVRPREAPPYSRRVLVPAFFDRDFWPSILPPFQIVTAPGVLADSTGRPRADSASRVQPPASRTPPGTPPASPRP
jgi:hypothetical protein